MVAALGIGVGSRVADVGAGGRIFAVEIGEGALSRLERLAEGDSLANIEVVRGEVADPRLPERSLDAVLVVEAEVRAAGYEVLERDPEFTRTGRGRGQWMLVARRPVK